MRTFGEDAPFEFFVAVEPVITVLLSFPITFLLLRYRATTFRSLVGGTLLCAVLFPNIDALFGLLGGTTAVVLSFVAPALFWERFVGYMYPWSHPRKLFCKALIGFSVLIAGLSLPGVLVAALLRRHSCCVPPLPVNV